MQAAMAGIGIGGNLLSGILGKKAGSGAAGTIGDAVKSGNDLWAKENADNHAMNDPFINLGHEGAGTLGYLLGIGPNDANLAGGTGGGYGSLMHTFGAKDFTEDPGYLFRLDQGQKALERSAAAKGTLLSGGTLKANDMYNQGFASNEYSNAFNRYMQNRASKYGMLSDTTRIGQNSANTQTGANDAYAGNVADNTLRGAFGIADANLMGDAALTKGIGGGLNDLMQYLMQRNKGSQAQQSTSQVPY